MQNGEQVGVDRIFESDLQDFQFLFIRLRRKSERAPREVSFRRTREEEKETRKERGRKEGRKEGMKEGKVSNCVPFNQLFLKGTLTKSAPRERSLRPSTAETGTQSR